MLLLNVNVSTLSYCAPSHDSTIVLYKLVACCIGLWIKIKEPFESLKQKFALFQISYKVLFSFCCVSYDTKQLKTLKTNKVLCGRDGEKWER